MNSGNKARGLEVRLGHRFAKMHPSRALSDEESMRAERKALQEPSHFFVMINHVWNKSAGGLVLVCADSIEFSPKLDVSPPAR